MIRWLVAGCLLFLTGVVCLAQIPTTGAGKATISSGGGCSQATAFLARTSGLSGTEATVTTNLICGMVSDGDFANLDYFFWCATNTQTTCLLNMVGTAYTQTLKGSGQTFTADVGLTGNVAGGFAVDTGFNPVTAASPHFANENGTLGACVSASRTVGQNYVAIGAGSGFYYNLFPMYTDGSAYVQYNANASVATANANATWVGRVNGAALTLYKNGTLVGTGTATSGIESLDQFLAAENAAGSPTAMSADTFAAFFAGSAAVSAANISARIHTATQAMGLSGC